MQEVWPRKVDAERASELLETDPVEAQALIKRLSLGPEDVFVDFGCGLGDMVFLAARRARKAMGVEPSASRVAEARKRFQGIPNAEIVQASLLEFRSPRGVFTRGMATMSLRRLDDALKCEFFRKISEMFQPGALFLLEDMIFDFDRSELEERTDEVLQEASRHFGFSWDSRKDEFLRVLKEEFPTGFNDWSAALEEGGFLIQDRWQTCGFYGGLLAKRR